MLSLGSESQADELARRTLELEDVRSNLERKERECIQLNVKLQELELKADCSSDQLKKTQSELQAAKQRIDALKYDLAAQEEAISSQLSGIEAEKNAALKEQDKVLQYIFFHAVLMACSAEVFFWNLPQQRAQPNGSQQSLNFEQDFSRTGFHVGNKCFLKFHFNVFFPKLFLVAPMY